MKLSVFQADYEVASIEELRRHLNVRRDGIFGSFWLWREEGASMALLIRGDEAYLHYFPQVEHPGFQLEENHRRSEGVVEFLADNGESTPIPSSLVRSADDAVTIFEEFFSTGAKSRSVAWTEL